MDTSEYSLGVLRWAIGLALGFPLAMVAAGEAILRLRRRGQPIVSTLRALRNTVLPALAVFLLLHRVVGLGRDHVSVKVVETVLWIFVIHAALAFVNDVIFASAREGSWQSRFPKLLLDLVRFLLVLFGAGIVLSQVWHLSVEHVITAFGVGSLVIGLALQEPLGNVFAGLMLLFERPLSVGDWIQAEGTTGKVVEMTWRSIRLETATGETRIVPNSSLYKGSFGNLSRPNSTRMQVVELGFSYDDAPNRVKEALREALSDIEGILPEPAPRIWTVLYDATVRYRVSFTVIDQENVDATRDTFLTRAWYVARRRGLTIGFQTRRTDAGEQADLAARGIAKPVDLLTRFPQFGAADDATLAKIAPQVAVRTYAEGERLVTEGERLTGLHLVLEGQASLAVRDDAGQEREIARVGQGEYFGESTLLSGQASEVSVVALADLRVLVIAPDAVQALVEDVPRLGRDLGNVLDVRRKAAHSARRLQVFPRAAG